MKRALTALSMALCMYTALPLPLKRWDEKARPLMLVFLPVVGLVLGLLWYGLALLMGLLALPGAVFAALLALYPYLITGHLHLDGYMDCTDAILSRRSQEEKRRILKDPHVGAFAVISLAALFLLCFAFAFSLPETAELRALIFVPAAVRCVSALCVVNFRPLPGSQYAKGFDRSARLVHTGILGVMLPLSLGAAFLLGGLGAVLPPLTAALACYLGILYARSQLGGMSGDVAGYGTVLGEAAALAAMLIG
jgi:adenosylcobinamide-GDP ribazoletransferase